jgi:xanthine dehydrogenase accessory factor
MLHVLVRGGGDLASGVILRLARAGWVVLVTEIAQPLAVRRLVSFSQAIYEGEVVIEGVTGCKVNTPEETTIAFSQAKVAVTIDPDGQSLSWFDPDVIVDARMSKQDVVSIMGANPLVIGLGPGFEAPRNCHAVVETKRGPFLGRVFWQGSAEKDTGIPDMVDGFQTERVLRAPNDGTLNAFVEIGAEIKKGDPIAEIDGVKIVAPFSGVLRGLLQPGLFVQRNMKIGDLDPRSDPQLCRLVSDKALAVGGGVVEAILGYPTIRKRVYHGG